MASIEASGTAHERASAFVLGAQRATNDHDATAAAAVYAPDAVLELVTDGLFERHEGRAAIERAWRVVLGAGRRRAMRVSKTLVAVDDRTIVNRWTGTFDGSTACCGIETWLLDDDGLVAEHRLETFLAVRPKVSRRGQLALLVAAPRVALALKAAERAGS